MSQVVTVPGFLNQECKVKALGISFCAHFGSTFTKIRYKLFPTPKKIKQAKS